MVTGGQRVRGGRPAGSGPRLNFLTAQLDADRIECTEIPFQSAENLRELQESTSGTHEVFRHGSLVRLVELRDGVRRIGDPVTLDVPGAGSTVAARLLQEALKRVVTDHWGFLLMRRSPPVFVSRLAKRDLLGDVHAGLSAAQAFHVYPEYTLDGRYVRATRGFGVLLGLKTRFEMDLSCFDLLRLGLDCNGRYVMTAEGVEPFPHQDPRYARRLLGIVRGVDGEALRVEVGSGVIEQHLAADLWLETRRDTFEQALRLALGRDVGDVLGHLEKGMYELTGGQGRLDASRRIARQLAGRGPLTLARGLQAEIGSVLGDDPVLPRSMVGSLSESTYVFDIAGDKTARYPEDGLKQHGPFDQETFTPKTPHLVVVTPSSYQADIDRFVRGFRDGVPKSSFTDGFVRRFKLSGLQVSLVTFDDVEPDAEAYRRACRKAMNQHPSTNLAIVIVDKGQQHLTGNASSYLAAKSVFMSQSVPVQEFQIESVRDRSFAEILRAVSLACYAKLGGVPFLLRPATRPTAHEVVIGLGSKYRTTDRMAESERSVGITTVFDALGNYMISTVAREADYLDYPAALLEALTTCIDEVRRRNSWQPSDAVRLVFHVFKPLRDREAVAVKRLVESLAGDFSSVEFAFLHVGDDHKWIMLDPAAEGKKNASGQRKGVGVPRRGRIVRLGRDEVLIAVHGPADLKTATQGAPKPLLVRLHRESTFTDMNHLAEQVFQFTAMSWRRPYPSSQPVSILYSELIAGLLGRLREVHNWNSDMLSSHNMRRSRWFL